MKRALVTGVTGQDGSYLAELLLAKGYEVHGVVRRASTFTTGRLDHLYRDPHDPSRRLLLHYGDVLDPTSLAAVLDASQPDEIYHLAAQSHVRVSFDLAEHTADVTALGTVRLLEAIRRSGATPRFFHAASSEMFGAPPESPQNELTPLSPRSPYAAAKAHGFWATRMHRDAYGLFAVNGILFNHESPRRGETFVTRKITRALARMRAGRQGVLYLGNLEARRDWGFAGDYVDAMWRSLQADTPDDYVVATGRAHRVADFLELAARIAGVDLDGRVEEDPRYRRPLEVPALLGDATRARERLGWAPRVGFEELVAMMVDSDLRAEGVA